jgi:hypothetical protein
MRYSFGMLPFTPISLSRLTSNLFPVVYVPDIGDESSLELALLRCATIVKSGDMTLPLTRFVFSLPAHYWVQRARLDALTSVPVASWNLTSGPQGMRSLLALRARRDRQIQRD